MNAKSIGISGQTFHSWCMGIIKNYPNIFESATSTCIDEEDRESAFKFLCGKKFKDKDNNRVAPNAVIDVYSYVINTRCSLSESIRVKIYDNAQMETVKEMIERNKPVYADVIKKYINYKKEHNYIDYDDILSIVASGLKKNKDVADFISSRYDHILVDEMQDTNPLQYELLSSFYDKCHLFCVGDDAQSIYGFRGADFKTMHNFTAIVEQAESMKLSLNYRSTQEILDVSNWMLRQSPLKYDKDLESFRGHGEKPKFIHHDNDWDEANHITDDILKGINERGYEYNDHMVISRTNLGLGKVEACCLQKKIPYIKIGGTALMQSKHVRDVMSSLRIAANFRDELAWVRYLQLWEGIGDATSAKIIQMLYECTSLLDCIAKLEEIAYSKILKLQSELYITLKTIAHLQSQPAEAISKAVECMSERLTILYKDNGWEHRKSDFELLEQLALDRGSIGEFIAEYVLDPKLGTYKKVEGKDINVVTLTTIHSAKGLEAANCYIVNASPWAYPTPRAILNGEDCVEEERRCLYVALTRAKDRLYIYKNIHSSSATAINLIKQSFYEGEIVKEMPFINTSTGKRVLIEMVTEKKGKRIVAFSYPRTSDDEIVVYELTDLEFRQKYTSENKYKSVVDNNSYFLNELPLELVDKEVISEEKKSVQDMSHISKISNDMDDFNFD